MEQLIECMCRTKLKVNDKIFRCPVCQGIFMVYKGEAREFEDAVIVEGKIPTYSECNGIGMFNTRKRKGNRFGEKM